MTGNKGVKGQWIVENEEWKMKSEKRKVENEK